MLAASPLKIMKCLCGEKAITPDNLCKECLFIKARIHYELRFKKYDRRGKVNTKRRG